MVALWTAATVPVSAAEAARPPSERELRTAMNRAEKRFFDLYNQVNDDSRHRVACKSEDTTGSRLRKSRTCRTSGEAKVGEEAAREYMRGLNLAADSAGGPADPSVGPVEMAQVQAPAGAEYADGAFTDARQKLAEERAEFDRHLRELMEKHPELKVRFDAYVLARTSYEAARNR